MSFSDTVNLWYSSCLLYMPTSAFPRDLSQRFLKGNMQLFLASYPTFERICINPIVSCKKTLRGRISFCYETSSLRFCEIVMPNYIHYGITQRNPLSFLFSCILHWFVIQHSVHNAQWRSTVKSIVLSLNMLKRTKSKQLSWNMPIDMYLRLPQL